MSNITSQKKENQLQLNLDKELLGNIILNVLGKKQKLTYKLENQNFHLKLNDLEQFYYLLEQKLNKENTLTALHFNVNIQYFDNTSREINDFESLQTFMETRQVLVKSVTLTWNIVLKFPMSKTVENQVIEVTFITNDSEFSNGDIILNIDYTNQALGVEILNLFKEHICSIIIEEQRIVKLYKKTKVFVLNVGYIFILLALFITILKLFSIIDDKQLNEEHIKTLKTVVNTKNNNEKVDNLLALYIFSQNNINTKLIDYIESKELKYRLNEFIKNKEEKKADNDKDILKYFLSFVVFPISLIMLLIYYIKYSLKYYSIGAYILLTNKTETIYNNFINQKNKISYISFSVIIFSIFCSIVANFIYNLFL